MANQVPKPPTASNILSSLGVRGATPNIPEGYDASSFQGFVPMLDADGKLCVDFIPSSAVESVVKRIGNVCIVDPNTEVPSGTQSGSAVAPYGTLHKAAESVTPDESGRCVILLMPGLYKGNDNSNAVFPDGVSEAYIIGVGDCEFYETQLYVGGVSGKAVFLQNLSTDSNILVSGASSVTCLGTTYVGGSLSVGQSTPLHLSSESRISSTDSLTVSYLSEDARIGNTSGVPGSTVKDAMDRLGGRAIRVLNFTEGSSGFLFGSDSWSDVGASSDGGFDVYDLRCRDAVLLGGINRLVALRKNIVADTVDAGTVTADVVRAGRLVMDAVYLGGYRLTVDAYGYLVVEDGGDSPANPPPGFILIEDTGSSGYGDVYAITVSNGRLVVSRDAPDTWDGSGSGSGSGTAGGSITEFVITDSQTGFVYEVRMVNGRLVIDMSSSSAGPGSELYAYNEQTGLYHRIVAVTDGSTGEVDLGIGQQGVPKTQIGAVEV